MIAEIRAVSLDVDDTLMDYAGSARVAFNAVIGDDSEWPAWQALTERYLANVIAGEIDYDTMRRERTRAFFADRGERLADAEIDQVNERRSTLLHSLSPVFDDAVPALQWLRRNGMAVVAITNASGSYQRAKLAASGLAEFFDEIVIAGEIGVTKPNPVIFHTACLAMGVAPGEMMHVGDRLDHDAIGARDAGLRGVWLDRSAAHDQLLPAGVVAIASLAELPELLISAQRTA